MTSLHEPRILVACIGNIFLGDDGFGVEVARRLAARALPAEVTVRDFGIRGFDLAYALMDPHDLVILVDACARGGDPGSVYLIEPEALEERTATAAPGVEGHSMNPLSVLRMVASMGGAAPRMLIVGCEPADLGPEEGKLGLSPSVEAAVDQAILLVETLISKVLNGFLRQGPLVQRYIRIEKGDLWKPSTVKITKPGTPCFFSEAPR